MPVSEFEEFKLKKMLGDPTHEFWDELKKLKATVNAAAARCNQKKREELIAVYTSVDTILHSETSSIDEKYEAFKGLCYLIGETDKLIRQ